jgi:hypothetical protein
VRRRPTISICGDVTLVAMNKKVSGISIDRDDFVVLENSQLQA